jgi:Tudor domain
LNDFIGVLAEYFIANDPLIKLESRKLKNNGEFINIHVILVSSPQHFVFQLQDDVVELNKLLSDMQSFCNTSAKIKSHSEVQRGECYAVHDDDARQWVR